jgi:hypothetical protein
MKFKILKISDNLNYLLLGKLPMVCMEDTTKSVELRISVHAGSFSEGDDCAHGIARAFFQNRWEEVAASLFLSR